MLHVLLLFHFLSPSYLVDNAYLSPLSKLLILLNQIQYSTMTNRERDFEGFFGLVFLSRLRLRLFSAPALTVDLVVEK